MRVQHVWIPWWDDIEIPSSFERTPSQVKDPREVTFYVPMYMGDGWTYSVIAEMPNLQYVQLPTAGYEGVIPYLRPDITLMNAKGVHEAATAELAVALAIASRRGMDAFIRGKAEQNWDHRRYPGLTDSRIAIVGFGSVGQRIAHYLSNFEVEITGYSRSGRNGSSLISSLDSNIHKFDVIFLATPLTAETHHLFDKQRLALMKDGALLVNVARGPVVDNASLEQELLSGRIFAALDVTDPEPLPKDHSLWNAPNLIISPHVGGDTDAFEPRIKKLISEQLFRIDRGEAVINQIAF